MVKKNGCFEDADVEADKIGLLGAEPLRSFFFFFFFFFLLGTRQTCKDEVTIYKDYHHPLRIVVFASTEMSPQAHGRSCIRQCFQPKHKSTYTCTCLGTNMLTTHLEIRRLHGGRLGSVDFFS